MGCASTTSAGRFRGAFSPGSLVVESLVLSGGGIRYPAGIIRARIADNPSGIGGSKFPLFVVAGHAVTVQIPPGRTRRIAQLEYGAASHTINFVSCSRERSRSKATGVPGTFWPGGIGTRAPICVPLDVWVDGEPEPHRVAVSLGRRCPAPFQGLAP